MATHTVDEVAERLDRHPESIRRNLRKGQLEGEKWSRQWIITDQARLRQLSCVKRQWLGRNRDRIEKGHRRLLGWFDSAKVESTTKRR